MLIDHQNVNQEEEDRGLALIREEAIAEKRKILESDIIDLQR